MYIYDQIREDTLYIILYTVVTVMTAMACIYLLFPVASGDIERPKKPHFIGKYSLTSKRKKHQLPFPFGERMGGVKHFPMPTSSR